MSQGKSKRHNFIFQAGVLAAAGIIVRIIGILYRSPLVMIIGDEGNGYYSTAYNFYTIILLVSSYSIPSAISKVIAARLGVNEYRNAFRLFIGALCYVAVVGGVGAFVCFAFASTFVGQNSAQVLRIFAPTIFVSGFLGTLRGYFQAYRTMVFTSFSQIIEQIANAIVSILMAYVLTRPYVQGDESAFAIAGAKGSAIGTGAGVLVAFVFMLLAYLANRKTIKRWVDDDKTKHILNPWEIVKIIFGMVTPVVLSTCIYNLSTVTNLKLYQEINMSVHGITEAVASTRYGLFSGKAMQIINIPIAIASAMSSAIIPTIAHTHERGEHKEGRRKIAYAIKVTMLIAMPAAMGLFALSEPVTMLLYPQRSSAVIVSKLIKALSITVVFYCLSTLSNAILQGTGHVNIPVVNAAISLVIQSLLVVPLLLHTKLDLYALVIATICYSGMMCLLNGIAMKKTLHYKQEMIRSYFLPLCAAVAMGLFGVGCNAVITSIMRARIGDPNALIGGIPNVVRLCITMILCVILYAFLVLHFGVATEKELLMMPKGHLIVRVCKKMGLIHEEDIVVRSRKRRKKK
ncbi:MAG: polysaccharide biosynthesis protein [Lachnospiraceae bacterium]|nr:polysaccharide biosynthesis protein [Candidatus Colinaster equi]